MKSILILEDDPERIKYFKSKLWNYHLLITDKVETAKAFFRLHEKTITEIFLDHDLEGKSFVASSEPNTGYQFAKWLNPMVKNSVKIYIHSLNDQGAENMKEVLPHAELTPFTDFMFEPDLITELVKDFQ